MKYIHHYGNSELISLINAGYISGTSLYTQEGILPGINYNVAFSNNTAPTLTFSNLIIVSGVIESDHIYNNFYKLTDAFDLDISGLNVDNYMKVYATISNDTIASINISAQISNTINTHWSHFYYNDGTNYTSPNTYGEYLFHRYSSYPWDKYGNMDILKSSTPADTIYIGYVTKYTVYNDENASLQNGKEDIIQFIPQYAKTGMIDVGAYIIPEYIKTMDTTNLVSHIKGYEPDSGHTLGHMLSSGIDRIIRPDSENKMPLTVAFTEVLYNSEYNLQDINREGGVEPIALMQRMNQKMKTFYYSGVLKNYLTQYDSVYPYYIYNDGTSWNLGLIQGAQSGEITYISGYDQERDNSLDESVSLTDAYGADARYDIYMNFASGLNYIILYIVWGTGNLFLSTHGQEEA